MTARRGLLEVCAAWLGDLRSVFQAILAGCSRPFRRVGFLGSCFREYTWRVTGVAQLIFMGAHNVFQESRDAVFPDMPAEVFGVSVVSFRVVNANASGVPG